MKIRLLVLSLILLSLTAASQTQFEEGYFIDNSGQRVECLIKNIDWFNNPSEFSYKISRDGNVKVADISSVKEFGIGSEIKFIRNKVKIDRSTSLSEGRNPNLKEEQLFLKVLLEGKYSLYTYKHSAITRFFFGETGSESIDPLVYRKYRSGANQIGENKYYQQQLFNKLKCTTIDLKKIEKVNYDRISLTNFFIKYYGCVNTHFTVYNKTGIAYHLFEPGYFVNNSGQKIECLIKNAEWKNNPNAFVYKVSENGNEENADINSVMEFGIGDQTKFIRSKVKIDRSTSLSESREPSLEEEELFLKVLFEGKYSLYSYQDSPIAKFFYKVDSSNPEQLIYKRYKTYEGRVRENNYYKQQLLNNLNCPDIKLKRIENLKYDKTSLNDLFREYNECNNSNFVSFKRKSRTKIKSSFRIRPRINNSSLAVNSSPGGPLDTDFGNKISAGLGLEYEIILPFNNNQWGISIEPTYQNFVSQTGTTNFSKVTYRSIEFHVTARRYFFLNTNSKLFANLSFVIATNEFSVVQNSSSRKFFTKPNFAFGVGYEYKEAFVLEFRPQTTRNGRFVDNLDFQTFSIIFGVKIN